MKVKTRFAPSPTGNLHIGSVRTALYSWLFARHYNGKFILRIEDTDLERSTSGSINTILNGLEWLGIDWDEGPYFQSKRLNRYKQVITSMIQDGKAYKCFCSFEKLKYEREKQISLGLKPRYIGTCRNLNTKNISNKNYIIRFKNPLVGKVTFNDQIRGKITFDNAELDDLVIQRSNGMPTYNFCVVIDDLDMNITHVIRGDDHINNTPRQINILKSLSVKIPIYAHLSMILNEDGNKISKRKNPMNVLEYRNNGFLPEALLNYILRLGWSHGNQEIFSLSEMKKLFNLQSISKSSSIIDMKKLLWINKYYINHSSTQYISNLLEKFMYNDSININNGPNLIDLVELFKKRYYTLSEMRESFRYFYEDVKKFNKIAEKKYLTLSRCCILEKFYKKIEKLSTWNSEKILEIINLLSTEIKIHVKEINMILRVSITGDIYSPSIVSIILLIGKEKILFRIKKAINYINNSI